MGIFTTLKQSKDPTVLKALNGYLRCNTKLAEAKVMAKFIGDCIERNEYPDHYWRALRRSRTVITTETLKRYAENQLESTLIKLEELERHVCQRTTVLDILADEERQEFDMYTQSIEKKRGEAKRSALLRSLHEMKAQSRFPKDPARQIDGVAMGSPLGPLLADVFMGKLEKFQLNDQIKKLKHYGRYVDDIFAIATTETDVAALLNAANQAHPSVKFTLEMESAGSLPFLDVLLNRRSDDASIGEAKENLVSPVEPHLNQPK
nr:unnamed protein product [Spirometra erinaceieuropaei]